MKKLLFGAAATVTAIASVVPAFAVDYTTSSSGSGAFAGMSVVFWCCCIGASMLIPIALAIFVYKDAEKSGVESPILWALITFFFGLIGLLLYFLVGKNNKK